MLNRKTFLVYANRIVSGLTGALGLFFISRFMDNPTYNYGVVMFAFSFVSVFTLISNFFDQSHIKRFSGKEDEASCMGTYVTLNSLATALMVVFVFGAIWSWQNILGRGFESQLHRDAIYIMLLYWAIWSLCSIAKSTFIAKRELAKKEILTFANQSIPTIFIIYVAISGGGAIELTLTYLVGGLITALLGVFFLMDVEIKRPKFQLIKRYWDFGWPTFLNRVFNKFGNRVDVILVQLFWSSVNVGYYSAARRLSMITIGMASAIGTVLFPTISNLHADGDVEKIRSTVRGAMRYISMFSLPVIAFMIFFPDRIIHIIMSDKFLPAVPVVRILAFQGFIAAFFRPINNTIPGMDKPKLLMKVGILANGTNIGLNLILIPTSIFWIPLVGLGEIGAATATLTAAIISSILGYYYVDKMIGIKIPTGTVYHIISAAVSGFLLYSLHQYVLPIDRYYHLIGYGSAMIGIYTGLLYLLGEFTKQDWDYIMDTIHPGEMWRYVKEELTGKSE